VQFDHAMLALLALGLGGLAWRSARAAGGRVAETRWRLLQPALPFVIVVALGSFLQLRAAAPFYEWMPGAAFIQFPWRLLALITPSLIVAAVYIADKALPTDVRNFVLGGAAAWMVVACGAFAPLSDPRIPLEPQLAGVSFSGFREYEPRSAAPLAEIREKLSARWAEAACTYNYLDTGNDEVPSVRLQTSCGRAAELPLPLYASALHVVTSSTHQRSQPCLLLPEFPTVCGAIIPAGDSTVSIKLPTVASLAGWAWRLLR
jgi:hypothetical protein